MLTKIRRYVLNPLMGRTRVVDLVLLVSCAACLALVYRTYRSGPTLAQQNIVPEFVRPEDLPNPRQVDSLFNGSLARNFSAHADKDGVVAVVLVFCSTRPIAIQNHLKQVLQYRPSASAFPIVVSQDGSHILTKSYVMEFVNEPANNVRFMRHEREEAVKSRSYNYISAHYKWALDKVFKELPHDYVIITEDDLDIAPDFFSYFTWAKDVLQADPSVWCASAWNDNGLPKLVDASKSALVWRCDFFPGLGWMLSRKLWEELSPKFPDAYWDDFMRLPEVRRNRTCIRPEIPRTAHNMKVAGKGSSGGLYRKFLESISYASDPVDFSLLPVDGILKKNYDRQLRDRLLEAQLVDLEQMDGTEWNPAHSYKVVFENMRQWYNLAQKIGIMVDVRGGMPRTGYKGIVPVMYRGCRLFIVRSTVSLDDLDAFQYDADWDKQHRYLDFAKVYCRPGKFTGTCDPNSPEMIAYFKKRGWSKKLAAWGVMIVV